MKITDDLHAFFWKSEIQNNCNTYLINGSQRVLIDPGHRSLFGHVQQELEQLNMNLNDIDIVLLTHGHPDHIEAAGLFPTPPTRIAIHEKEWTAIQDMASYFFSGTPSDLFVPDFFLQEGDLSIGEFKFKVFHTPGHTPGSICLYWTDFKILFTGDLIFEQGLGRTDLPGGNSELLKESIQRMSKLDIELTLPGHGPAVVGKQQNIENFDILKNEWFGYI